MGDDPEGRAIRKSRSTWKDKYNYFLKLLENVLLTGVPQIVTETDRKRKIFKISVLVACLSGFLYHLISFILLYMTYPTSLEVLVKFQDILDLPKPTITICDMNGIRRKPFCRDFPEKCEKPKNMQALCSKYNYFCSRNNDSDELLFPTYESFQVSEKDRNIVIKYGTRSEDILNLYSIISDPIIYINSMQKLRNCYSIDLTDFDFKVLLLNFLFEVDFFVSNGEEVGALLLSFNPEESFYPTAPIGAKISIHNKDQLVNPFVDGFLVKPGMSYNIQLKAIEENLLGSPYSTNCSDYNVEESSVDDGSYNRDRCLLECQKELWLKYCNCVTAEYNFHFHGNFCTTKEYDCIERVDTDECYDQCKISCKFTFFEYEVDESPFELEETNTRKDQPDEDWWNDESIWFSTLNIYFKRPEVLVYKYKPQYEFVEFFSYVGGYIGIWLGISLIAVCDFLEMLFIYCYYVFRGKIPISREPKSKILLENKSLV